VNLVYKPRGNGGPFHEALELSASSFFDKIDPMQSRHSPLQVNFSALEKEKKKRICIRKRLFIESREFGIDWHNLQCGKELTIMIILTKGQVTGPSNISN